MTREERVGVLQEATGGDEKGLYLTDMSHTCRALRGSRAQEVPAGCCAGGGTAPHCPRLRPDHCHTLRAWEHPFLLFLSDTKLSL